MIFDAVVERLRIHHPIAEPAVVTHHHHHPLKIIQILLQHRESGDVQVVGGFVQHQDVGPGCQTGEQLQPAPLPAAQSGHLVLPAAGGEGEFEQEVSGHVNADAAAAAAAPRDRCGFAIFVDGFLVLRGSELDLGHHELQHLFPPFAGGLQAALVIVAEAHGVADYSVSLGERLLCHQSPQEGCFAGAVAADDDQSFPFLERVGESVEQKERSRRV
mmetsp:Transcript_12041/g.26355  ORF Transcript_12041/g.26355 Transcript_12041/m.26355 type:complete len:216 (+) Transcript_12041:992-1639(+)